jgi:hypothetical protein
VDLDTLSEQLQENHIEVVQRLTRLETQTEGLPGRVVELEKYQNKAVGIMMAASAILTLLFNWLLKRFSHG